MAAATTTLIAGLGALIAAGAATHQAVQGNQQRIAGERSASAAQANQEKLIQDQKNKEMVDRGQQQQLALSQRQRMMQSDQSGYAGGGGLQSTILTSPLGVTGGVPSGGKTILGG